MAQTIKLKRSSVEGRAPTTSDLELGEIAINTFDGKVYIKKNDGTESIVEVGQLASFTPSGNDGELQYNDGGAAGAASFTFIDDVNNRLGLGTDTPSTTLEVSGTVTATTFDGSLDWSNVANKPDPTLTLNGDVSGSATFTDLGDATLTVTVANDSHTHDGRYYTETESDARFVNVTGDTMTGNLDVTGTVTADGLTVDGTTGVTISGAYPTIFFGETDTTDLNTRLRTSGGSLNISTVNNSYTGGINRFNIDHSTGDISFYEDTGTTPKFFWDASAERLGIGTTSPGSSLTIEPSSGWGLVDISPSSSTSSAAVIFRPYSATSGTNEEFFVGKKYTNSNDGKLHFWRYNGSSHLDSDLVIDSSGNVGIGTTSPNRPLTVVGADFSNEFEAQVDIVGTASTGAANTGGTLRFSGNDGSSDRVWARIHGLKETSVVGSTAAYLSFETRSNGGSPAERMRIDSSGNVGIGTTAPASLLHISSADASTLTLENTTNAGLSSLHFRDENGVDQYKVFYDLPNNRAYQHFNGNALTLYSTQISQEVAKFGYGSGYTTSYLAGDVGIGDSSPEARLHVQADGGSTTSVNKTLIVQHNTPTTTLSGGGTGIVLRGVSSGGNIQNYEQAMIASFGYSSNNSHGLSFWTKPNASTALTQQMLIANDGKVGIGTTSPITKVDIIGTNNGYAFRANDNVYIGYGAVTSGRQTASRPLTAQVDGLSLIRVASGDNQGNAGVEFFGAGDRGSIFAASSYHMYIQPNAQYGQANVIIAPKNGSTMNVGIGTTSPSAKLDVAGDIEVNSTFTLNGEEATLATTTQTEIASFSATSYGGGKFVITAKDGSNRHIVELLVTHDETTAVATQYGSIYTSAELATYDVDISGGNVRILATSASTNSTLYKVAETLMEA